MNASKLKELRIPLPNMAEQRRVAAFLDRAQILRARRRDALNLANRLVESAFVKAFGGGTATPVDMSAPKAHPRGWKWELLTDVARLATGHTPDRTEPSYWNGEIPWITLTEIRALDGSVASTTTEAITQAGIENSAAVKLPAGTVCFSRTASIGFVTVMGREMATSQDFVNWVCGPRLLPLYLMYALIFSRDRLRALAPGSTHKTIYFPVVEQFRVLLPPLQLQQAFARKVESIDVLKRSQLASQFMFDELFGSLQHRAFAGSL